MAYSPKRHLWNSGVAFSQLANAVLLAGDPDESVSGRAGKGRAAGHPGWTAAAFVIDLLIWPLERNHCARSIERDEGAAAAYLIGRQEP
jgi:hypothetical protein